MDRLRAQLHSITENEAPFVPPTPRNQFGSALSSEPPLKKRRIENTENKDAEQRNENAFASPEPVAVHSQHIPWSSSPNPSNGNLDDEWLIFPDHCCVSPNPFEPFPFGTGTVNESRPESLSVTRCPFGSGSTLTLNGNAGEDGPFFPDHCSVPPDPYRYGPFPWTDPCPPFPFGTSSVNEGPPESLSRFTPNGYPVEQSLIFPRYCSVSPEPSQCGPFPFGPLARSMDPCPFIPESTFNVYGYAEKEENV